MSDDRTEIIKLRVSRAMARRIDKLMVLAGYRGRANYCRSVILAIINDDAKAHGEKPLDEVA